MAVNIVEEIQQSSQGVSGNNTNIERELQALREDIKKLAKPASIQFEEPIHSQQPVVQARANSASNRQASRDGERVGTASRRERPYSAKQSRPQLEQPQQKARPTSGNARAKQVKLEPKP